MRANRVTTTLLKKRLEFAVGLFLERKTWLTVAPALTLWQAGKQDHDTSSSCFDFLLNALVAKASQQFEPIHPESTIWYGLPDGLNEKTANVKFQPFIQGGGLKNDTCKIILSLRDPAMDPHVKHAWLETCSDWCPLLIFGTRGPLKPCWLKEWRLWSEKWHL